MNNKIASIIIGVLFFGVGVCVLCNYLIASDDSPKTPLHSSCIMHYQNYLASPPLPDTMKFCGETVPLHLYWVKESLDRELINHCYNHSRTLLTLKRSTRFFPIIEKILKEENLPEDLKYLCVAESNLENVVSQAKAAGFWQFMENTAKNYSLEINENVDERYHLEKSTFAACKYLSKLKYQFEEWALAAAAYNMGENGLLKTMKEQQIYNYWDLLLNQETSRYLFRCIAYKLIFENQELYNICIDATEFYKPIEYKEVLIDRSIEDIRSYCTEKKILYRQLKELNPWLRSTRIIVPANKSYLFKIPV